jgi:predicted ATP-dependent serine protease
MSTTTQNPQVMTQKPKRGRPAKQQHHVAMIPSQPIDIKIQRGSELSFSESLFIPMKIGNELDTIFSTEGGLMPGVNMVMAGGAGSGKTTIALDALASLTEQGYKCLFVSGEMDEIGYYKYCRRMPRIAKVPVLFLKPYGDKVVETLEQTFDKGWDVVVIDSIAEVTMMFKSAYKQTESAAETWLLALENKHKKGHNSTNYYTTFINIQQMTKQGEFVGSNRLKHMADSMCKVTRTVDGLERSIHFEKNRDCDKDYKVFFAIRGGSVQYTYQFSSPESED